MKALLGILSAILVMTVASSAQAVVRIMDCGEAYQFDPKTGESIVGNFQKQVDLSCKSTGRLVSEIEFSPYDNRVLKLLDDGDVLAVLYFPSHSSAAKFAQQLRSGAITGVGAHFGNTASDLSRGIEAQDTFVLKQELNGFMKAGFRISNALGLYID